MKIKPCVIGLGYVGLPALIKISKNFNAYGYDINEQRINSLKTDLIRTKIFQKNFVNNKYK